MTVWESSAILTMTALSILARGCVNVTLGWYSLVVMRGVWVSIFILLLLVENLGRSHMRRES